MLHVLWLRICVRIYVMKFMLVNMYYLYVCRCPLSNDHLWRINQFQNEDDSFLWSLDNGYLNLCLRHPIEPMRRTWLTEKDEIYICRTHLEIHGHGEHQFPLEKSNFETWKSARSQQQATGHRRRGWWRHDRGTDKLKYLGRAHWHNFTKKKQGLI